MPPQFGVWESLIGVQFGLLIIGALPTKLNAPEAGRITKETATLGGYPCIATARVGGVIIAPRITTEGADPTITAPPVGVTTSPVLVVGAYP